MSVFEQFMNDIFSNEDFVEDVYIENLHYKCITTAVTDGISFTDAGRESEENFALDIKLPVKKLPVANDKVKFRNKWYKVSYIETDSTNTSIKVYLIALSKGIG